VLLRLFVGFLVLVLVRFSLFVSRLSITRIAHCPLPYMDAYMNAHGTWRVCYIPVNYQTQLQLYMQLQLTTKQLSTV
jgi:hypothetical protein